MEKILGYVMLGGGGLVMVLSVFLLFSIYYFSDEITSKKRKKYIFGGICFLFSILLTLIGSTISQ